LWIVLGMSFGVAAGVAVYTFGYAKGASYLTNDPAACANCHVMHEQYDGWQKSSHHAVAGCNDCHTPSGLFPKYLTKATNGFWHSFYFTTGNFPEPIRIRSRNRAITEGACRKCHEDVVDAIDPPHARGQAVECLQCHNSVGHPEGLGRWDFASGVNSHE
jgi:cytochrome c nitrite reductase small subunit